MFKEVHILIFFSENKTLKFKKLFSFKFFNNKHTEQKLFIINL